MAVDHRVSEISSSRPRLRRDVRTHYQEYRGEPSYIIEDTSKGRFFHVGFPEHQCDGRKQRSSSKGNDEVPELVFQPARTEGLNTREPSADRNGCSREETEKQNLEQGGHEEEADEPAGPSPVSAPEFPLLLSNCFRQ